MERFWVFDWLRENSLTSPESIERALNDKKAFSEFRDAARQIGTVDIRARTSQPSLVAGQGIDITGEGVCVAPDCIISQADDMVRHVWHYFDEVVVADLTGSIAALTYGKANRPYIAGWLKALAYLDEIGASSMLRFYDKPLICRQCLTHHADYVGLEQVVTNFDEILLELVDGSDLEVTPVGNGAECRVSFCTPLIDGLWTGIKAATWVKNRGERRVKEEFAKSWLHSAYRGLFVDMVNSQEGNAPLGATAPMHQLLLKEVTRGKNSVVDEVAFNLRFPMLDELPTREIIKIRDEHMELFRVFQDDLRASVRDVVKAGEDEKDAHALAREVERERIRPALNKIELAVKTSANPIARGLTATVVFTGVTVAVMRLTQNPILSAGIAAAVNALGWANSAQSNRETINNSQMYFLFELTKAARAHAKSHRSNHLFVH